MGPKYSISAAPSPSQLIQTVLRTSGETDRMCSFKLCGMSSGKLLGSL